MIRVQEAPEPASFESAVRQPGLRAIAEMVGEEPVPPRKKGRKFKKIADSRDKIPAERFPSYWTEALDDLMVAYHRICAYSCFRIHPVTGGRSVDHMAAKSLVWDRVYEWRNYRLASSLLNGRKRDFPDVLDPFLIGDDWFELELVGFQVKPAKHLDAATKAQVRATIDRLGLDDFKDSRERDAENYLQRRVSFGVLMEESPFVARELKRQGRVRPEDL
jgi:hypothetical protein